MDLTAFARSCAGLAARVGHLLWTVFLSPGSTFSVASLASALAISVIYLTWRKRHVRFGPRALVRALFPAWLLRSASLRADVGFFLLNTFITGTLIGWALLSYDQVRRTATAMLVHAFGGLPAPRFELPLLRDAVLTLALFLAYDFAYWVDHALKHKIPALWEFHRVHHTAEVLSPLTVFRVHPIDSLIFYNISALTIGVVHGIGLFALGGAAGVATLSGTNVILVLFVFAVVHLQHSHIPIRFEGRLGRLFFSPAHHQIHHSVRAEHYGSNLGSCLAIWDWMFGTLIVPEGERLTYGVDSRADRYAPHSVSGGLILPFIRVAESLMHALRGETVAPGVASGRQGS